MQHQAGAGRRRGQGRAPGADGQLDAGRQPAAGQQARRAASAPRVGAADEPAARGAQLEPDAQTRPAQRRGALAFGAGQAAELGLDHDRRPEAARRAAQAEREAQPGPQWGQSLVELVAGARAGPGGQGRREARGEPAAQGLGRQRADDGVGGQREARAQAAGRAQLGQRVGQGVQIEQRRHRAAGDGEVGVVGLVGVDRGVGRVGRRAVDQPQQRGEQAQGLARRQGVEAVDGHRRPGCAHGDEGADPREPLGGARRGVAGPAVGHHRDVAPRARQGRQHAPQSRGLAGDPVGVGPRPVAGRQARGGPRPEPDRPRRGPGRGRRRGEGLGRQIGGREVDPARRVDRGQHGGRAVAAWPVHRDVDQGGRRDAPEVLVPDCGEDLGHRRPVEGGAVGQVGRPVAGHVGGQPCVGQGRHPVRGRPAAQQVVEALREIATLGDHVGQDIVEPGVAGEGGDQGVDLEPVVAGEPGAQRRRHQGEGRGGAGPPEGHGEGGQGGGRPAGEGACGRHEGHGPGLRACAAPRQLHAGQGRGRGREGRAQGLLVLHELGDERREGRGGVGGELGEREPRAAHAGQQRGRAEGRGPAGQGRQVGEPGAVALPRRFLGQGAGELLEGPPARGVEGQSPRAVEAQGGQRHVAAGQV